MHERRPGLDPAVAEVRRAVRAALDGRGVVIVALSGGADSLALAAATAFEAPRLGIRAEAVVIDHGLQGGSDAVAAAAAEKARALGLDARVVTVRVGSTNGPEAAAREARYAALTRVAAETGADAVLLGHTLDDQAETVLLGLARGSGATSLSGMAPERRDATGPVWLRPMLGVRRETTVAACAAEGLEPWTDPHNADPAFARVRVREIVLPVLERELGPGVAEALARTAEQLREDAAAFQDMIDETIEDIVEHAEAGISVSVAALAANPAALRNRIVRYVVDSEFGVALTRAQTLEVARLATDWHGQGPIDLPGCLARRVGGRIEIVARAAS
ncbi:MAG: tRNA lysidine(34) synthetase TilS [Microbacterium sp. 71-36]|uniref:tRNA lysidine(34) synthetase TilS n=1 Tax=unclassified Microbacterium TaxID=2609290 RepID=UPI00086E438B|nr:MULTISPECIES: tRNA lysidine(34) synthetase TilS [unclassified Microbacterium]MBN9210293.1 tRNA lysidine(34) synthetase TilS [Microbacterium sp.]ODT40021.1 MAG: tRNA lysidine(34) synthetase TilS [Microbacterium sp. SCN 71-17]ODU49832.1 MAG: tRNA lysidine(34) synthetase TilS [Microbacterium sp. SCN 70-10]OJV74469.1 MAG: tRNA lysidine(34) synthetase TilS [Microbacterium sp. 71-36]